MSLFSAEDRRRSERYWAAVPVLIRYGEARVDAVTINISEGGMYLFAAANLPLGTRIEMEFLPPGGKQLVRVFATIRRRALYLYGIEFLRDEAALSRRRPACDTNKLPA